MEEVPVVAAAATVDAVAAAAMAAVVAVAAEASTSSSFFARARQGGPYPCTGSVPSSAIVRLRSSRKSTWKGGEGGKVQGGVLLPGGGGAWDTGVR